jgi:hypothetical protein
MNEKRKKEKWGRGPVRFEAAKRNEFPTPLEELSSPKTRAGRVSRAGLPWVDVAFQEVEAFNED